MAVGFLYYLQKIDWVVFYNTTHLSFILYVVGSGFFW